MSDGAAQRVGIVGRGYSLPATIRTNDDPIFDWLKKNDPGYQQLFYGYGTRHVLKPGESIVTTMQSAARSALDMAKLDVADVDLLLGFVSVSDYEMPNGLSQLHQMMGLSSRCWIIPLNVEYSNFNAGLVLADAMIRAGQVRNALVVCGGNWSRYVNYHLGPSVSAADGAGAAVVARTADASTFRVVDFETITETMVPGTNGGASSPAYGNMYVGTDAVPVPPPIPFPEQDSGDALPDQQVYTQPYFHITAQGMAEFGGFGVTAPIEVVQKLLTRNALPASKVTLTAHQTSRKLLDAWAAAIQPKLFFDTLSTFANMTLASIPVNFAFGYEQFKTDHVVLLGIGPELHTNAVLLRRGG
ncbi:MAG: 3-oxoacyl-ACP synthase [Betaproteobacteria bacterium]|nr:3-oxoacyl-ACP synthase [Betaproteobacteria bacterium]